MIIESLPFRGPAGTPGIAITGVFKLAAHIFIFLLKLLADTEQIERTSVISTHHSHLRRAINSARSFLKCSIMERCLWVFSL